MTLKAACAAALLVCCVVGLLTRSASSENIPEFEFASLYDIYNALDGENWKCCAENRTMWNFTEPNANPCVDKWEGVECAFPPPFDYYYVSSLILPDHNLTGTLPYSMGNLSQLSVLDFDGNDIYSTIPESIGGLSLLRLFELEDNAISGTFPNFLSNLSDLRVIAVGINHLSGTLPTALGKLTFLDLLLLTDNFMTGSLPAELGNMTHLHAFHIVNNSFTGTVPASICQLGDLQFFDVHENCFTGSLPSCFGGLTDLNFFSVSTNSLSGQLPAEFGQLAHLFAIHLTDNLMSGPIPESLGNTTSLRYLQFGGNSFSGQLPESLGNLINLEYGEFFDNRFSGSIPASLTGLYSIENLYLNNNYLTGSIPDIFSNMSHLSGLDFSYNLLVGTIPTSLSSCSKLEQIWFQYNYLTGSLYGVFNASQQLNMFGVQLNDNQLTGSLPDELFLLPSLSTVVAISNCFHGSLPPSLCNSSSLVTLILDGLSSATSCRNSLFFGLTTSYILEQSVGGSLPGCLFQLPNLATLQLSGNGFHGELPASADVSPALSSLILSHNVFTGSIPNYIQLKAWLNLDLSFNRLSGTLRSDFAAYPEANNSLYLENNRLSGRIPNVLYNALVISMLGSNLFGNCEQLPENDSGRIGYECGSTDFMIPCCIWFGLLCCIVAVSLWGWRSVKAYLGVGEVIQVARRWWSVCDSRSHSTTREPFANVGYVFDSVFVITAFCSVYTIILLAPLYTILTYFFHTYTVQYAYTVSAMFLKGYWSFSLVFVFWLILICVASYSCLMFEKRKEIKYSVDVKKAVVFEEEFPITGCQHFQIGGVYTLLNFLCVGGVNVAFVYVSISGNNDQLLIAQILLAFFKFGWNQRYSYLVLRWVGELVAEPLCHFPNFENYFVRLQVSMHVVNNIFIPCFAVFAINPSCFYNLFVAPPSIDATYTYYVCGLNILGTCRAVVPVSTEKVSFLPPFEYSYQCGSSLIMYYAPIFVGLCIITILIPVCDTVALLLRHRAIEGTRWCYFLDLVLPRLLKETPIDAAEDGKSDPKCPIFNSNRFLISVSTYLAVLCTFGIVFPPLAVVVAVTIIYIVGVKRLQLGRFVVNATDERKVKYVDILETDCRAISAAPIKNIMQILILISCLFFTVFLFDTLGDTAGFRGSYWIIIVEPLIPLMLNVGYGVYTMDWAGMRHEDYDHDITESKETADFSQPHPRPSEVEFASTSRSVSAFEGSPLTDIGNKERVLNTAHNFMHDST